ncbi:hypothetical protein COLO4_26594 [Corchorus olitorius]|uniref:Uncharacterized protein n=1 Tax=Corchorus olitorius TaxID=93759 RepID=A0A1R3HW26_9ROSI|nr:hypothetical protein COLO4_26594 [Corchorus olitorius]
MMERNNPRPNTDLKAWVKFLEDSSQIGLKKEERKLLVPFGVPGSGGL